MSKNNEIAGYERAIADLNKENSRLMADIAEKEKKINEYRQEKIQRVPIALSVYPSLEGAAEALSGLSTSFSGSCDSICSAGSTNSHFARNTLENLSAIKMNVGNTADSIKGLNGGGPRSSTYYGVAKAKDDEDVAKLESQIQELNRQIENNNETISSLEDSIGELLKEDDKK